MKALLNLLLFHSLADSIRASIADAFSDGEEFLS